MRIVLVTFSIALLMSALWVVIEKAGKAKASPEKPANASTSASAPGSRAPSNRRPPEDLLSKIDWQGAAKKLASTSKQFDKFKPSPEVDEQFRQLSKSELLTALQAVNTRNHTLHENLALRRYLTTLLVQKDPEGYLLNPDATPLDEQSRLFWEGLAISEWARTSPADAKIWLDSEAESTRDSKQMERLEHNLFSAFVATDLDHAKAFLLKTPEERRFRMFQNFDGFGIYWTSEDFTNQNIAGNFAELTRLHGKKSSERLITMVLAGRGEQDRAAGISRIQDNLRDWKEARGTWLPASTVADYLDKIQATPQEQELCLDVVAGQFKYYKEDGDPSAFRAQYAAEVEALRSGK